jgi:ribosomal protein S27AE
MRRWGSKPTCTCGACQKCKHRAYMQTWRRRKTREELQQARAGRNKELAREQDRLKYQKLKADPSRHQEMKARWTTSNAIRDGRLLREPCSECGATPAQAHHDDYAKPLDVRWLCQPCHVIAHNPQLKAAS